MIDWGFPIQNRFSFHYSNVHCPYSSSSCSIKLLTPSFFSQFISTALCIWTFFYFLDYRNKEFLLLGKTQHMTCPIAPSNTVAYFSPPPLPCCSSTAWSVLSKDLCCLQQSSHPSTFSSSCCLSERILPFSCGLTSTSLLLLRPNAHHRPWAVFCADMGQAAEQFSRCFPAPCCCSIQTGTFELQTEQLNSHQNCCWQCN